MPKDIIIRFPTGIEKDDDGTYHVWCPELKGLHASGNTKEEAFNNLVLAAELYMKSLIKHAQPEIGTFAFYVFNSNFSYYKRLLLFLQAVKRWLKNLRVSEAYACKQFSEDILPAGVAGLPENYEGLITDFYRATQRVYTRVGV